MDLASLVYSSCSELNSSTRSAVQSCKKSDLAAKNPEQCKQDVSSDEPLDDPLDVPVVCFSDISLAASTSQKTVTLKKSDIRTYSGLNYGGSPNNGAWDLMNNNWIFSGAGDITFTLPAGDAKVFSLVPNGHSCVVNTGRLICNRGGQFYSVLDYRVL